MYKSYKTAIHILFFLFSCIILHAQPYVFFATKNDFHLYDTKKNLVIKNFEYMQNRTKGVLWRPTEDLSYVFLKNIPNSAQIIRMRSSDQNIETFTYSEEFNDFQVISEDLLVIKTETAITLWPLSGQKSTTLLQDFSGIYFYYDHLKKILITQDPSHMIALHTNTPNETTQFLDRAQDATFFTFNQGKLTYLNSFSSWVTYDLETQNMTHHKLEHEGNMVAVWPIKKYFFIQQSLPTTMGKRPGTRFFIYNPINQTSNEVAREQSGHQNYGAQIMTNSLVKVLTRESLHLGMK
ncbi:MAG: hypothetical protein ACRCVN_03425 [Spirochaetia bacterium]